MNVNVNVIMIRNNVCRDTTPLDPGLLSLSNFCTSNGSRMLRIFKVVLGDRLRRLTRSPVDRDLLKLGTIFLGFLVQFLGFLCFLVQFLGF